MTPERRGEIALRVVSVVVVGSVALALAGLTWRLVGWDDGRSEVAVAETLPLPGVAGGPAVDSDVARIVSLAPFGGAADAGGLPASTLGLVLKGVLMAEQASASTALIAVGEGPTALYGVGQTPVGDAVIESIAVDHVVLTSGGVRQRLDFPVSASPMPAPPPVAPGAGITVAPAPTSLPPSPVPSATGPAPASSGTGVAQSAAMPSPNPAAAGVAVTASGYRIGPNPAPELRRFGLQPGDVIESLNDQPVGEGTSPQQLVEAARQAGQARVVILREGRRLTVNLPLARSPA